MYTYTFTCTHMYVCKKLVVICNFYNFIDIKCIYTDDHKS